MISFCHFLQEARMAPLYHGTRIVNIPDIINVGLFDKHLIGTTHFKGMKSASQQYRSVSTARSIASVEHYLATEGLGRNRSAIIVLDQDKLSRSYRIIPHDFYASVDIRQREDTNKHAYRSETEESIILRNNKPIPLKKYAIKVLLPNINTMHEADKVDVKSAQQALNQAGIPWEYRK